MKLQVFAIFVASLMESVEMQRPVCAKRNIFAHNYYANVNAPLCVSRLCNHVVTADTRVAYLLNFS